MGSEGKQGFLLMVEPCWSSWISNGVPLVKLDLKRSSWVWERKEKAHSVKDMHT